MNEISGVLILDKPCGFTSHDAVNKIRRLYDTKKVGHTGTLDPMATGVLVMLIGRAAKAAEYLVSDDKKYIAGLLLGEKYDTGDITGKLVYKSEEIPPENRVESVIQSFVGESFQLPPMYSAVKIGGKKLVDLARKGIEVERKPRKIEIFSLGAHRENERSYTLDIHCSKGTYIRTLCEDIGEKLGCGAAMSSLRRISSGNFEIAKSHTLEELENMDFSSRAGLLLDTESLFSELPKVKLSDFYARLCASGQEIYLNKINIDLCLSQRVRIYDKNGFFALGEVREFTCGRAIKPIKQFVI